jgi:hypothetical protein
MTDFDNHEALQGPRSSAIAALLRAVILGSLRPLKQREVVATAELLLNGSWADVTRRDLLRCLEQLDLEGVETDYRGRYYARDMPSDLSASLRRLREAESAIADLESLEGCDTEALRKRQVDSLYRRPLLQGHEERLLGRTASADRLARTRV